MLSNTSFLLALAQLCFCWTTVEAIGQSPRLSPPAIGRLVNKKYIKPARSSSYDDGPTVQYASLPINHLDPNSETFLNRYWVDDYFYQTGGPVFFVDNGEDTADGMEQYLREGASGSLAETFGGLLILWEHRFYGTSMPNMTSDMQFEPEQLESYLTYLTVEQAMEDVSVFARSFSYPGLPSVDLTPGVVPWVFVGGSYPGARAAWMRLRNPEIFHASLASSAVIELEEDFWEYYHVIETTMETTGWANCSADMRALAGYLNTAFDSRDATAVDNFLSAITGPRGSPLYRYFHYDDLTGGSDPAWDNRRINMRAAVEIMFQDFQYVGMDGFLGIFCDGLQAIALGRLYSPLITNSAGIFTDYKRSAALGVYAKVLQTIWTEVLEPSNYPSPGQTVANTRLFDCENDQAECQEQLSGFSWMYQVCSEFGAFQVTNSSRSSSLLPKIESVDSWVEDCINYYGSSVADGPNIAPVNKKYGGWDMSPSNVFFTSGELDPWRALTMFSAESASPARPSTTTIPASGQAGDNTFFGYLIEGSFHCADLGNTVRQNKGTLTSSMDLDPDSDEQGIGIAENANTAHTIFIDALNVWLPAFEKHSISSDPTITTADVTDGGSKGDKDKKSVATVGSAVPRSAVVYSLLVSFIAYSIL